MYIITYTNETFPWEFIVDWNESSYRTVARVRNFRIKQVGVGAKFPVRKDNKADDSSVSPSSD